MTSKKVILALAVLLSLALNSCISIDRKIKINTDGSGDETIKIVFSREFYSIMGSMSSFMDSTRRQGFLDSLYSNEVFLNKTKEGYDSIRGIKILDMTSERGIDSSNTFVIKYQFDSINRIGSSLDKLSENEDSYETTVNWIENGDNIDFNYIYQDRNQPLETEENDSLTQQMKSSLAELFKEDVITIQVEFPYEVVSSNAMSANGNILNWNFPLNDVITTGKMQLEAKLKR